MDFFALQGLDILRPVEVSNSSSSQWFVVSLALSLFIFMLQGATCAFSIYSAQASRFFKEEAGRQSLLFLAIQTIPISIITLLMLVSVSAVEFDDVKFLLIGCFLFYFGLCGKAVGLAVSRTLLVSLFSSLALPLLLVFFFEQYQGAICTVAFLAVLGWHCYQSINYRLTGHPVMHTAYSVVSITFLVLVFAQELSQSLHSTYLIAGLFFLMSIVQWGISISSLLRNFEMSIEARERDQLKLAENEKKKLQQVFQNLHDEITGCPSDGYLVNFLNTKTAEGLYPQFTLFSIKVRGLRSVQNALGIDTSNGLLKSCAQRLAVIGHGLDHFILVSQHESGVGCVVRGEGQEFYMVADTIDEKAIQKYCEKIVETFSVPFEYGGLCLDLQSNVGVSLYPEHGHSPQQVLQRANIAVDIAKRGHYPHILFDASLDPSVQRRLILLGDLRGAMNRGDVYMTYQPQMDVAGSQITGIEALIRWNHPLLGQVPPDEFIGLAEQTGMIKHITPWVCDHVAMDLVRLNLEGYYLKAAINISAHNLLEDNFASIFLAIAEEYELPLASFCLELTETAVMLDADRAIETIQYLTEKGVSFSIDDFGTGSSSLVNLKRFKVRQIKIDKDFIFNLDNSADDEAIVKATIEMAHCLGVDIIAEGVETLSALEKLKVLECSTIQGYYLAKSMPIDDLVEWLASRPQQTTTIKSKEHKALLFSK
ncbi:MAG: EAL domain-containing protein [Pseudomonadota bacterium]|nr:EAL domain-containing protein [Pseudomonadota bacterium]